MSSATLNCTGLFLEHARTHPDRPAIHVLGSGQGPVSFGELLELSARAQKLLRSHGVGRGDSVLLLDSLGPRMYAIVIATLALGASVILVEPWMPVEKIERVIRMAAPRAFVGPALGRAWGLRVAAIRAIPHWISTSQIAATTALAGDFIVEPVDAEARGILTFTSGTTGAPKGVSRTQGRLVHQHRALSAALQSDRHPGADLCIFANFALSNLADGRASVIMPQNWNAGCFAELNALPKALRPETATMGPAFLLKLLTQYDGQPTQDQAGLAGLRSIHVGGALTDCAIFERGFKRWSEAHWAHVYGGSEAEPVAVVDAREAVRLSRARGYFQTLYVGKTVPEVSARIESDSLWVAGNHVCAEYIGNPEENRLFKRIETDADGKRTVWHCMGDRVTLDPETGGLWYSGRSGQPLAEFALEQLIYSDLGSSKSFLVTRKAAGSRPEQRYLIGENVRSPLAQALKAKRGISETIEGTIHRDRRHRARIDRVTSLRKAAPWIT
jgi:acyl-coenzyme A synthetase/AMP-(fatty) acid ligase